MGFQRSRNDVVNTYIENLGEEVAPLFIDVRATILDAAPELNESIKWKNCLVYGTTKNLIQTVVGKGKISLIFFEGASFDDAYGQLEGEGKKARTMRIQSLEYDREALRAYVRRSLQE